MRALRGITAGCVLALATIGTVAASPSGGDELDGAISGDWAVTASEPVPVEVRIDLARALIARRNLIDELGRLPTEGEAVLGETARPGEVRDETLIEMLTALRARAGIISDMGSLESSD